LKIYLYFSSLRTLSACYGTEEVTFLPRGRDLPFCSAQKWLARLPQKNAAYIKGRLFSRFRLNNPLFRKPLQSERFKASRSKGDVPFFLIVKRRMPLRSH
jgi:hypothetical protein